MGFLTYVFTNSKNVDCLSQQYDLILCFVLYNSHLLSGYDAKFGYCLKWYISRCFVCVSFLDAYPSHPLNCFILLITSMYVLCLKVVQTCLKYSRIYLRSDDMFVVLMTFWHQWWTMVPQHASLFVILLICFDFIAVVLTWPIIGSMSAKRAIWYYDVCINLIWIQGSLYGWYTPMLSDSFVL